MQEILNSLGDRESLKTLDILQHQRAVKDQSQLNSQQRFSNLTGALSASMDLKNLIDHGNTGPLIVVDDLITTGATLVEAIRALTSAGYAVLGAVTGAAANPYD